MSASWSPELWKAKGWPSSCMTPPRHFFVHQRRLSTPPTAPQTPATTTAGSLKAWRIFSGKAPSMIWASAWRSTRASTSGRAWAQFMALL